MTINETLTSVLQFLAMNENEKIAYLPRVDPQVTYYHKELDEDVLFPSRVVANSCYQILDREFQDYSEEMKPILNDLKILLYVALDSDARGPYMWVIEKGSFGISGPYDGLWDILRRIASLALKQLAIPSKTGILDYSHLAGSCGWIRVRIERYHENDWH
jgi:hypothetical protein